jgi:hypothetical protein
MHLAIGACCATNLMEGDCKHGKPFVKFIQQCGDDVTCRAKMYEYSPFV